MSYQDTIKKSASEYFDSEIWKKAGKSDKLSDKNIKKLLFPGNNPSEQIKIGAERSGYFAIFTAKGAGETAYGAFKSLSSVFAEKGQKGTQFRHSVGIIGSGLKNTAIGAAGATWNLAFATIGNGIIVNGAKAAYNKVSQRNQSTDSKGGTAKSNVTQTSLGLHKTKTPTQDKTTNKTTDSKSQAEKLSMANLKSPEISR